ncbi:putative Proteasome subunit alpha type-3 [Paratrimastix pyriformis]|uniref:Proteasome subunit alpha type-3 n=1 Tax=Paratrimastix pyriformis TaxID=342808 RepID=A0ABQ8U9T7_9EUKA|nr:putative Proteasome subunit alpha type-3 [Paratrimastix pyriformis]|eukprot:GAFH01003757.1.p1 GENE.GAFH01003757.1~~GAFH01003757.1.p1  ORF type:complete len:252 (-),score=52.10 GAFH01003757.1:104-859(-)
MSHGLGSGYDLSAGTYSQDGRVFQVEYAAKAVENSGNAIGIRGRDCVVLGVDKPRVSEMLVRAAPKNATLSQNIGMTSAGLVADCRTLANWCREECRSYKNQYHTEIPVRVLSERLSLEMQEHTTTSYYRPYGATVILGGFDEDHTKPQLFMVEPSGKSFGYRACSCGMNQSPARTELEKLDLPNLGAEEAVMTVARILHQIHDESKNLAFELELSWACAATGFRHVPVPPELLARAEEAAKRFLEERDHA